MNRRETDHEPDQQYIKNTDSTALAVAIVAGLLGLHSDLKPYDGLSLIFGVTLLTTTIAYIRGHFRKRMQSLGVAFTVGFISLPIFGYVFELICKITIHESELHGEHFLRSSVASYCLVVRYS